MSKPAPVIADNRMFPDLSVAIKVLGVDEGLETFEYTETRMGHLTTPTQAQIQGLIIGAMRDLNPEDKINQEIFDRISDDSEMQAAVLASHVQRMSEKFPVNVAREATQTWTMPEVTIAGTSDEEEE